MRVQLDLQPVDLGGAERLSPAEAAALAERMRVVLVDAGFVVAVGRDRADVDVASEDWRLLTAAERAGGGFGYPELTVAGPAGILVDVFLRSVFISTEPDFDAGQAATAQVVTVLRALDPMVEISEKDWDSIEQTAAEHAVSPDGSILRPVLSWSELSDRAIDLFDHAVSPEHPRPIQDRYAAELAKLCDLVAADQPTFRASIAADPTGSSFGLQLPDESRFTAESVKPLRQAMRATLSDAIAGADDKFGVPTGVVVNHDHSGTTATIVFDNLVDAGAQDPAVRAEQHRTAPFAWQDITTRAARRDPAYQPTWLVDAIALLAAGGTDVHVNGTSSASPERLADTTAASTSEGDSPGSTPSRSAAPRLRDRLRSWFSR